jgi:hypothetical protein
MISSDAARVPGAEPLCAAFIYNGTRDANKISLKHLLGLCAACTTPQQKIQTVPLSAGI